MISQKKNKEKYMSLIEAKNYTYTYAGRDSYALKAEELTIEKGEFVLLRGKSGSGKTTFLRRLAEMTGYRGKTSGSLLVRSSSYGFVWQDLMQRRLAEVVTYFGLEDLIHKDVNDLSSGEARKVSVAAAMALKPELLLLDEPTAILDPVASEELKNMLDKIHDELGTTIVIAEHNGDIFFKSADKVIYIEDGVISEKNKDVLLKEQEEYKAYKQEKTKINTTKKNNKGVISLKNVRYRYPKADAPAIMDCELIINEGIATYIVGANGSGKSTLAKLVSGHIKPSSGRVRRTKEVVYLPPEVRYLFLEETIAKEIANAGGAAKEYAHRFGIDHLINDRSPMDISIGERQRLALSVVLSKKSDIYILDEPTMGIDEGGLLVLLKILFEKKNEGGTILVITHDIEFAGKGADMIGMMYDGRIIAIDEAEKFLSDNLFYTTRELRLTRR